MLEGQAPAYERAQRESPWFEKFVYLLDVFILQVSRHWLAIANLAVAIYLGSPFLAPYLASRGHLVSSQALYWIFSFLCHQQPSRSFFVFDHQVAICQRDVAMYGGFLAGGLTFALVRSRLRQPLSWRAYLILNLPLAVDGLTQLVGLRESTWLLRLFTGGTLGLSSVWLVYPLVQKGMEEAQSTVLKLLAERRT